MERFIVTLKAKKLQSETTSLRDAFLSLELCDVNGGVFEHSLVTKI